MIKVYVTGFDRPYAVSGELVSEDEEYLVISEEGVNKRIPQRRIVFVEEFVSAHVQTVTPQPQPSKAPLSPIGVPGVSEEGPLKSPMSMKEALEQLHEQKKARAKQDMIPPERVSQVEPEEKTYSSDDLVDVTVAFKGAKEALFELEVPREVMTGAYTSALGKEIFSYPDVRKVLIDGTAILDGVPEIKGNHITYNTKSVNKQEPSTQVKMSAIGDMINAGDRINELKDILGGNKSMPNVTPKTSDFSMPASPFKQLPTLSLTEGE